MVKYEIDLFKLHIPLEDAKSLRWVSASGTNLNEELVKVLKEMGVSKYLMSLIISKENKISNSTVQKMFYGRSFVPIIVMERILQEWKTRLNKTERDLLEKKIEIQRTFEQLKVNASEKPIKAIRYLSEELCKIVGAHVADGSLNLYIEFSSYNRGEILNFLNEINNLFKAKSKLTVIKRLKKYKFGLSVTSNNIQKLNKSNFDRFDVSITYQISIIDEDKQAVEYYGQLLEKCFGIKRPEITYYHNAWGFNICNKIIGRFLRCIFDLPIGKKSEIVKEPKIIRESSLKCRRAFACGVMTFDGTVELRRSIRLDVKSKYLRDSIKEILNLDEINVTNYEYKNGYTFHSPINLKPEIARKWLSYFIEGTEKHQKIYEIVNGFSGKVNSAEEFKLIIDKVYPAGERTKTTLSRIFDLIKNIQSGQLKDLAKLSCISHSQLLGYLRLLIKMNVIVKSGRIYQYNNLSQWRIPVRDFDNRNLSNQLELPKV